MGIVIGINHAKGLRRKGIVQRNGSAKADGGQVCLGKGAIGQEIKVKHEAQAAGSSEIKASSGDKIAEHIWNHTPFVKLHYARVTGADTNDRRSCRID